MSDDDSPSDWRLRPARMDDVPQLEELIPRSARHLQADSYSPAQIEAALGPVFGVDRQLITDGTYFVAVRHGAIIGCGGWSRRHSRYGGDALRNEPDPPLDPKIDPARVRAFFVCPDWARKGIGRAILMTCESAIRAAGFGRIEIVATLEGEKLYRNVGYTVTERFEISLRDGLSLPAVRMAREV